MQNTTDQTPASPGIPHSREAEEAVLGSVLINPEIYYDVAQVLKAEDFYIFRNRWIWGAITEMRDNRTPIDLLTLSERLEVSGKLVEIGGSAYLTSLVHQVPTSLNAEAYAQIVSEHSLRRKMISSANKIASLAYREGNILSHFAEGKKFYEESVSATGNFQKIGALASKQWDIIEDRANGKDDSIIPTGFTDLDDLLDGGMRKQEFLLVGARPGMGKTGFLLDIIRNTARMGFSPALFSLEMSNEQVTQRLIAKDGVSMKSMRTGKMSEEEWRIFQNSVDEMQNLDIYMDDLPSITPSQVRARAHSLHNRVGIDLLVVDYIQLVGNDSGKVSDNRNNEIGVISRSMKVLARELNIPVLCAAQLSRDVEKRNDKRPLLSDLRDSGTLEQDSDIVMFMYRDEHYNPKTDKPGIAECNVAKQRDGQTKTVDLVFRGPLMKFENAYTPRY